MGHRHFHLAIAVLTAFATQAIGESAQLMQPEFNEELRSAANTGGSRVTFAAGMALTRATEKVIQTLRERAAMVSAPFDSYISEVLVRPGDLVADGAPLLRAIISLSSIAMFRPDSIPLMR